MLLFHSKLIILKWLNLGPKKLVDNSSCENRLGMRLLVWLKGSSPVCQMNSQVWHLNQSILRAPVLAYKLSVFIDNDFSSNA